MLYPIYNVEIFNKPRELADDLSKTRAPYGLSCHFGRGELGARGVYGKKKKKIALNWLK